MISRIARIHREFGTIASARTGLLFAGLIGMSLFGLFGFNSVWAMLISVSGLILGWLCRRQIVDAAEFVWWALPSALFVFGVLLFVGEKLGLSREGQLLVITLTTVVTFNLQFWSLSDPSIVKVDDDR